MSKEFITMAHYPGGGMPTYEYKCTVCTKITEMQLPMDERDDVQDCSCGESMKRMYTAVPVKFNGSGFYSTGG